MAVPPPPVPFEPLDEPWPADRAMWRVHLSRTPPNGFGASPKGRFRPITRPDGSILPTLYAADSLDGALAETVFHDVPRAPSRRRAALTRLAPRVHSKLELRRDLRLASFRGFGLGRLGVSARQLTDTGSTLWAQTAAWGQAAYEHGESFDGIVWMSRQLNTAAAVILFGGRVSSLDLVPAAGETMIPLAVGSGLAAVEEAAGRAGITITRAGGRV